MALLKSLALCLLGILICGSFLEAEAAGCDEGWGKYEDDCYKLFEKKLTWAEAEIECQNYGCGAHLASINSEEESAWVAHYVSNYVDVGSRVWMGLIDFRQNGKWSWADGTDYNYRAWMMNQPDTYEGAEYCGELARESEFREWNDAPCTRINAYLCKIKQAVPPNCVCRVVNRFNFEEPE